MKKFFYSKIFMGISCFFLGFITNNFITKIAQQITFEVFGDRAQTDRIPVNSDDFDYAKLMDAAQKLQREMLEQARHQGFEATGVERREDDLFVYYDVPLNEKEKNERQLKVKVERGVISLTEHTKDAEKLREFSIGPGLDETGAVVMNLSDRITIKIPKIK